MPSALLEFQLVIRNADNTADFLTITSVRGGTNPWLSTVPSGDGQEFDPLEGGSRSGAYTGRVADGITSGTDRVVTSQLEDAGLRQQLPDRRATLRYRLDGLTWNVLVAGYLTALRLVSGAEYEYTVSDASRAAREFMAFAPKPDPSNPDNREDVSDFLNRWPQRGCIFGGPIRVSGVGSKFLQQEDRGGWEMKVDGQTFNQALLTFSAGYTAPRFGRETDAEKAMAAAKERTDGMFAFSWAPLAATDRVVTFQDAQRSSFPGVIVEVIHAGTGNTYGLYQAMSGIGYFPISEFITDNGRFSSGFNTGGEKHLLKDIRHRGIYIGCKTSLAASGLPAAGADVRVRCFTAEASELSPIYWTGHPCALITKLWDEADQAWDSAAASTTTNAIGAQRRITIRAKKPVPLEQVVSALCAGFGIGVRVGDDGELELFKSWITDNVAPTVEITSADASEGAFEAFAIDAGTAVKKLVFEHTRLVYAQDQNDPLAVDGFVEQTVRVERTNGDVNAVGKREVTITVPGMVHASDADGGDPDRFASYVDTVAREVFDRYGRGVIEGEVRGLRGTPTGGATATDALKLGNEILNKLKRLPNHNKRLGDDLSVAPRAMQIVRSTWTPTGPILKLIDSGPNAQPYATLPTLSIAASSGLPRIVALVTVTNAATLNADSASLKIQWAVSTGAAPASTDYTDVVAFGPGEIPTTAISLPAVVSGRKVYVRASAWKAGARFSAWSTPVSVTLTGITAPSGLAATPSGTDGSIAQLAWTVGDSACLVDVLLRLSAGSVDVIRDTLPRGSSRYTLDGLTPGVSYTVGVRHRDEQTGDTSSTASATFTAGATSLTLAVPVYASGFSGSLDESGIPQRDAIFGIGVIAADNPGFFEVAVAVETTIGSGVPGSFVTSGTLIPNVLGNWTIWSDVAANDGLRRYLKGRHVRDGATASAYTSTVTVTPWTPQGLPGYPTEIVCQIIMLAAIPSTEAGTNLRFQITGIDPVGNAPQVEIFSLSTGMSVVSGAAVATPAPNNSVWKVSQPIPTSGPGTMVCRALVGDRFADQTVIVPEATTIATPNGTVAVDADGNWESTIDCPSSAGSFRWSSSTSAFPADATVLASGTLVAARTGNIAGGPLTFGQTVYITVVPFLNSGGTATSLTTMHIRGAYLTYTASKTVNFSSADWNQTDPPFDPAGDVFHFNADINACSPDLAITSPLDIAMQMLFPVGVTLTSISNDVAYGASASTNVGTFLCQLYRKTTIGALTLLANNAATYNGGTQVITAGLAEAVSAGYTYLTRVHWVGVLDNEQAKAGTVAVTYSMPDPKKTY